MGRGWYENNYEKKDDSGTLEKFRIKIIFMLLFHLHGCFCGATQKLCQGTSFLRSSLEVPSEKAVSAVGYSCC